MKLAFSLQRYEAVRSFPLLIGAPVYSVLPLLSLHPSRPSLPATRSCGVVHDEPAVNVWLESGSPEDRIHSTSGISSHSAPEISPYMSF